MSLPAIGFGMRDDVVRRHAASGTPEQVRAAFAAYHAVGLDEVVIAGAAGSPMLGQILETALGR